MRWLLSLGLGRRLPLQPFCWFPALSGLWFHHGSPNTDELVVFKPDVLEILNLTSLQFFSVFPWIPESNQNPNRPLRWSIFLSDFLASFFILLVSSVAHVWSLEWAKLWALSVMFQA
jgi:hypothetical protein